MTLTELPLSINTRVILEPLVVTDMTIGLSLWIWTPSKSFSSNVMVGYSSIVKPASESFMFITEREYPFLDYEDAPPPENPSAIVPTCWLLVPVVWLSLLVLVRLPWQIGVAIRSRGASWFAARVSNIRRFYVRSPDGTCKELWGSPMSPTKGANLLIIPLFNASSRMSECFALRES